MKGEPKGQHMHAGRSSSPSARAIDRLEARDTQFIGNIQHGGCVVNKRELDTGPEQGPEFFRIAGTAEVDANCN